jgi:AcrR family transcriptional regulator
MRQPLKAVKTVVERKPSQRRTLSTRAQIIEVAGRVFADKGYEGATGREICERAQVNAASISYHFGGMAKLYHEVLLEAYETLVSFGEFDKLLRAEVDPEKRFWLLCQLITKSALRPSGESWELRLIGREALSPSGEIEELRNSQLIPKIKLLRNLVGDLLGLPIEHPAVALGCLQVMAPIVLLQVGDWAAIGQALPALNVDALNEHEIARYLYSYMLGGLRAGAAQRVMPPSQK